MLDRCSNIDMIHCTMKKCAPLVNKINIYSRRYDVTSVTSLSRCLCSAILEHIPIGGLVDTIEKRISSKHVKGDLLLTSLAWILT